MGKSKRNIFKLYKTELSLVNQKIVIAGPCSAESEDQLLRTAIEIKRHGVSIIRAGAWKPRTHPHSFEGVGEKALEWMIKVKQKVLVPVATEVANPIHVEQCLKYGIDILWIGSRATTNPFSVQAIADALKGVDIPVMIKNPINPDIELWIGAIERLMNQGISKLIAIHRGFSMYKAREFRNPPLWRIPIELKRRMPELPIVCDPSHICGNIAMIQSVAQKAIDLLYDGLMIEVHYRPNKALSDAKQSLTPNQYGKIINDILFKVDTQRNKHLYKVLNEYRKKIDGIDNEIIKMLSKRMDVVRKIGEKKNMYSLSLLQPDRWSEILSSRMELAKEYNLPANFIKQVYEYIHEEALKVQLKG